MSIYEQEPVAWHEPGAYGNVTTHAKWAKENGWLPLYDKQAVGLIDLYISDTRDDPHNVWIGSLRHPGEGGEFSKTAVNAVLKKFYDDNL